MRPRTRDEEKAFKEGFSACFRELEKYIQAGDSAEKAFRKIKETVDFLNNNAQDLRDCQATGISLERYRFILRHEIITGGETIELDPPLVLDSVFDRAWKPWKREFLHETMEKFTREALRMQLKQEGE